MYISSSFNRQSMAGEGRTREAMKYSLEAAIADTPLILQAL